MPPESVVDRAIKEIAQGRVVDWDALESGAQTDQERDSLKRLRDDVETRDDSPAPDRDRGREPSSEELTQKAWGRYRLQEKVGAGSFGSVYRAWDSELEREIAIKILHGRVADSQLKERLLREGRALARVRHPNVVSVFGVESDGDRVGLCMEFVRGETLETAIRTHGTLNAREAALVGEDVCRALAAVHRAGFVHRDVKARNVMREQAGRVVLMDFGTGREADRRPGRLEIAGTPVYMAPEVLEGHAATPCSDVYSVGVLLYHLVTSEYPVEGRSMDDLRAAHARSARRSLSDRRPDIPAPFAQVVGRALARDPRSRFPSAGALLDALLEIGRRDRARKRTLLVSGVAVVGAAGVATGLGILSSAVFNSSLERSAFVDETVWDWFVWGVKSCVGPAILALFSVLGVALVAVLRRLVLAISGSARRIDAAVRTRLLETIRRLRLDDPSVLASVVLLSSGAALLVGWWEFRALIGAIINETYVSMAPARDLAPLSPDFSPYHENFRLTFIWLLIISLAGWYLVARQYLRKHEPVHRGLMAGGAAVVLLAAATLDFPYRLLYFNEFEVVRWQDQRCYDMGERAGTLLLFCPDLQPRDRTVKSSDPALERTGLHESVFARFSRSRQ